jgi:hypothetical protein
LTLSNIPCARVQRQTVSSHQSRHIYISHRVIDASPVESPESIDGTMARSFASKATRKRTKASTTRQPDRILKNKSSSKAKQAVQLRARKDARGHAKKKDMEGGKSVRPEAEGDHRSAGKMRRSGGKSKATRGYDAESNGKARQGG